MRIRQIVRCRETATLRRPQKSNTLPQMRGWVQNQLEHHLNLIKYEAAHPTFIIQFEPRSTMTVAIYSHGKKECVRIKFMT